jgi:pimeloyl-ACP methyl ester carboxylesterase
MAMVARELCDELGTGATTHFHFSACNTFLCGTTGGIAAAGVRVAQELRAVADAMPLLAELSLVGHSLGGMFLRYALYELHRTHDALLERAACKHFVTIATPHIGIRRPLSTPLNWVFLYGASTLPGLRSAHELCLAERRPRGTPPLLFTMATDEAFLAPLRRFATRRVYSNVWHDFQVSFSTAAIRSSNPYRTRGRKQQQRGAPLDGSDEYPNITAASQEAAAVRPLPALVQPEAALGTKAAATFGSSAGLEVGFRRDAKRAELAAMVASLGDGDVSWERFDVLFRGCVVPAFKSHEWIVGKNARTAGACGASLDVCRHLGRTVAELSEPATNRGDAASISITTISGSDEGRCYGCD